MSELVDSGQHCPVDPTKIDLLALGTFTYGLYVVTSASRGRVNGLICNTVVQVALRPCQVSVSINKSSLTHEYISESGVFAVSVLEQDTPLTSIGIFGFRSGRNYDKFAKVAYRRGETGCPLLEDHALATIEARVRTAVDCGSHTTFVADVLAARRVKPGLPLTYAYYHQVKGGKTGKGAPTYGVGSTVTEKKERTQVMKKYRCAVCGYEYDPELGDPDNGVLAGTPFEKLPDDWVCPVCGAGKDQFEPVG